MKALGGRVKERGWWPAPGVSVVHQRLLEKAEVGLAEAVTATVCGLLSAKVSFSLSVPFGHTGPLSTSWACYESVSRQVQLLQWKSCIFVEEAPLWMIYRVGNPCNETCLLNTSWYSGYRSSGMVFSTCSSQPLWGWVPLSQGLPIRYPAYQIDNHFTIQQQ